MRERKGKGGRRGRGKGMEEEGEGKEQSEEERCKQAEVEERGGSSLTSKQAWSLVLQPCQELKASPMSKMPPRDPAAPKFMDPPLTSSSYS